MPSLKHQALRPSKEAPRPFQGAPGALEGMEPALGAPEASKGALEALASMIGEGLPRAVTGPPFEPTEAERSAPKISAAEIRGHLEDTNPYEDGDERDALNPMNNDSPYKYNWVGPVTLQANDPRIISIPAHDPNAVATYAGLYEAGSPFPEIVLIWGDHWRTEGQLAVYDGRHRLESAKTVGTTIEAYIGTRKGTVAPTPKAKQQATVPKEQVARPGLGGPSDPIDLAADPRWHHLFYGTPTPEGIRELGQYLRSDPNRFIRLYHGTLAEHPIMGKGLLPTSATRAKSLGASPGFVCMTVFPGMAEDFAHMAYPGKPIQVYAVDLTIRRLLPDLDQLNNRRHWGEGQFNHVRNTLVESLVFGHGARVKGKVEPFQITLFNTPRRTP